MNFTNIPLDGGLIIKGIVTIRQYDIASGRLIREQTLGNQITNGGAAAVAQWLCGVPNRGQASIAVPYPAYMELGDGTGTPAPTDTDLFSPNVATNIHVTQSAPSASNPLIAEWVGVWGPSYGPYSAGEIGLLSAQGTLFSHVMAPINLSASTSTSVTWRWATSV